MWKYGFGAILLITYALGAEGSVVFPLGHDDTRRRDDPRTRRVSRRNVPINRWKGGLFTERRGAAFPHPLGALRPQLAFSPAQAGKYISLAALIGYFGRKLQSESVSRALYFWRHAGPVVMHYKFTRWYLRRTKAPLEKRDRVYNSLHDKYCNRCLDIALTLRGLYVKVSNLVRQGGLLEKLSNFRLLDRPDRFE